MKGFWKHLAASAGITAIFLASALAVSVMPAATPAVRAAEGSGASAFARSFTAMVREVSGATARPSAATASPAPGSVAAARPTPATAVPARGKEVSPAPTVPAPSPSGPSVPDVKPDVPDVEPDLPAASAINPGLPAPSELKGEYVYTPRNPRILLSWRGVSHPQFRDYEVEKWEGEDFPAVAEVYSYLAEIDPGAAPYAKDLSYRFEQAGEAGLTQTEREEVLAYVRKDVDALNAIMAENPEAADLWEKLLSIADRYTTKKTWFNDKYVSADGYYLYVVVARYGTGETSAPSGSVAMYTYRYSNQPPAVPTGFIATAYDPGVALEWNRNTESDLAGYDVYLLQGTTPVKLNAELITRGTEFFHMTGAAGSSYQVVAVSVTQQRSSPATATAVLAPARIYDADNPAWLYPVGTWARENYASLEVGGRVLRVSSGAGSRASLTFTGRRVRVFSARYWSCGTVNYYVDGQLKGTFDLYHDGGYTPDDGGPRKPALWQQKTFEITGLSKGQHTLVVEASGIPGAEGFDFVNFDYAEVR